MAEVADKTLSVFTFEWKQSSKYNINDASNCQKYVRFFFSNKMWIAAVRLGCWCNISVFSSPGFTCLFLLPLPHRFRNLMNCTNLRLTPNPVFLSVRSQAITGGESYALTIGTWELVCTYTLTVYTHTLSHTVELLIDRVIDRFKIHLSSTVRQTPLSPEFNRLSQTSSWSNRENVLILRYKHIDCIKTIC